MSLHFGIYCDQMAVRLRLLRCRFVYLYLYIDILLKNLEAERHLKYRKDASCYVADVSISTETLDILAMMVFVLESRTCRKM